LYKHGNIEQLTDCLMRVLTDHELRRTLERGGLEWSARFNWDDAAKKFDSLIKEIAEQP